MREIAAQTHAGKVREHNEDAIAVVAEQGVCVVADGVGGHQRGEVASQIVCDTIREDLIQGCSLVDAVAHAHNEILSAIQHSSQGEISKAGMGSTVVVVRIDQASRYELAWVGDSRVYLWNGALTQLNRDHSVVEELLAKELITPEQARTHPERNVITQSLGVSKQMQLDVGYQEGSLGPDEQLLLCSDGLTDELRDTEIASVLADHQGAQAQLDALMENVLASPARDNVSIAVVAPQISEQQREPDKGLGKMLNVGAFVLVCLASAIAIWHLI
ncbi:MAG: protein phosphatase 2C domain-containing protein [Pseudomonadota bacterium]